MKTTTKNNNFKIFRNKVHFEYSHKGKIFRKNLGINESEQFTPKNQLLIQNLKNKFNEIIFKYKLENSNNNPPADFIKNELFKQTNSNNILELFDSYILSLEQQKEIKPQSITPYKSLRSYLKSFITETNLNIIDQNFITEFINFLNLEKHNLQKETLRKRIIYFKTFITYLLQNNYIKQFTPFYNKKKYQQENVKHVESLNTNELKFLIKQRKIETELKYKQVLNMFVFQCLTSLRFGDLKQVNSNNIKNNILSFLTEKTNTPIYIPLNNLLIEILKDNNYNLNYFSNSVYNQFLKELFSKYAKKNKKELPELNNTIILKAQLSNKIIQTKKKRYELFTSHTARRTFITMQIHLNTPLPLIMKLTGHKKINILNEYLNIYNTIKANENKNIINEMLNFLND